MDLPLFFRWHIRCEICMHVFSIEKKILVKDTVSNCCDSPYPLYTIHCQTSTGGELGSLVAHHKKKNFFYIETIDVDHLLRQNGIARRMLNMFLKYVGPQADVQLEVCSSSIEMPNQKLIAFYRTAKFELFDDGKDHGKIMMIRRRKNKKVKTIAVKKQYVLRPRRSKIHE